MSPAVIDLNDASLCILRGEATLHAGPGYAAVADGRLVFGELARTLVRSKPRESSRRHWSGLSEAPLPQPLLGRGSTADLVQSHLETLWSQCAGAQGVALVVMPGWTQLQLGLLLGIARDLAIPVTGLVDPAIAASRRPFPGRSLWHLHATLDAAWISRIEQEQGQGVLGARVQVERCGIDGLERGCAEFLRRRFVECSRFDPLHDPGSEQRLFDLMPTWLQAAARQDRIPMELEAGRHRFEAWFDAAELRDAVACLCEPLTQRLRALLSPRDRAVLQLHGRLADFPGVLEALMRLPGCTVVLLEPAAAARGALRLDPARDAAGGVPLSTALPWNLPPGEDGPPAPGAQASAPTHVVFAGRAWRVGAEPLHIGTDIGESEYGIPVRGRAQAVSRRHCSIQLEDGRVMVHDQSRYGTLLNGHRIEGTAVLQAGDVLTLGQPPLEFALIAEVSRGT